MVTLKRAWGGGTRYTYDEDGCQPGLEVDEESRCSHVRRRWLPGILFLLPTNICRQVSGSIIYLTVDQVSSRLSGWACRIVLECRKSVKNDSHN
jgi:hypothetical protein